MRETARVMGEKLAGKQKLVCEINVEFDYLNSNGDSLY